MMISKLQGFFCPSLKKIKSKREVIEMNYKTKFNKKLTQILIPSIFCISLILLFCTKGEQKMKTPMAEIENVPEIFHGVKVNDPYRWLENWDDPTVRDWSDQQNAYARSILDNLPNVKEISERVSEIQNAASINYYFLISSGKMLFAMKNQPPLNQPLLVTLESADNPETERIIVDPNILDNSGSTSIDWYVPSPDGKHVGVSLSVGGSEMGDVHIFETETGNEVGDVIERVNGGTAGGDMAWLSDGSGFYYTRYPRPGERPNEDLNFYQQVWFHRIGTSITVDYYVIGKDFPRIAEIKLAMNYQSGHLLIILQYGDSGKFAHYILFPNRTIKQITTYEDKIVEVVWGADNDLYLISCQDAPRGKILHLTLADLSLQKAKTIIPETDDTVISSFSAKSFVVATNSRLFVTYQLGGPSGIRMFSHQGTPMNKPDILPVSSIQEITPLQGDNILFRNSSYIDAPAWYLFNAPTGATNKTALFYQSPVDYSDTEVVREYATSKDGTKIPVNIIRLKETKLDGTNPVLLNGYGGFNVSMSPGFSALRRVWIEQGGIVAIANIRGGGEFGEDWHRAGSLTHKQNCFDDFAAAMQYLIEAGYTNPQKLAIMGGSNGGLLMGAMITQHPELLKATVSSVGIYDMLRNELTPNGNFNIPEYGTVKDADQFKALYAYSPYHNVKEGTPYPAVLFMTGANDPRVDPMHSRKMTARLQATTTSNNPILLRTSSSTGHGIGTPLNERIKEDVDEFAFLFYELGIKYKAIR
jgi:prolyl oligopeptidase